MNDKTHSPGEIKDLIIRFLRHTTSAEEVIILENWLNEDPSHKIQFDKINTAFQAVSNDSSSYRSIDDAWKLLSAEIDEHPLDKKLIALKPSSRLSLLKIAASVIILISASIGAWRYVGHLNTAQSLVVVEASSSKKEMVLSDGTKVWLNANSLLEYGADFGKKTRTVKLKGEAFFDVTKTGIDFIVQTDNLSIQVKGTRFNVSAFNDSGRESTTLEEGRVVLKIKGTDRMFDMHPGDQVTFNSESKKISHRVVNPTVSSAWKKDEILFEKTSLAEIIRHLESRYNVTIKIDSAISTRENLTITIREESLEEVLELIKISSLLQYTIKGNDVVIYE